MILIKMSFQRCKSIICLYLMLTLLIIVLYTWIVYPQMNVRINIDDKHDDEKLYICPLFMGRLGNTMFQYAAAYGMASERNMSVLLPRNSLIARSFKVDSIVAENVDICSSFSLYKAPDNEWAIYNPSLLSRIPRNRGFRIHGYYQSFKYFLRVKDALKRQFLNFHDESRLKAFHLIQEIKEHYLTKLNARNVTLVGVHVRRGDSLSTVEVQLGRKVAPKDYFIKAMDYFNSKNKNNVFVVCGEDITWASEFASVRNNIIFLNQSSTPDVDMAILTMCDHIVASIGSYSWWSAFLISGEVVYYKDWIKPGSYLYQGYKYDDYFPPEWIPM